MQENSDRADSRGAEGVLTRDYLRIVMAGGIRSSCNRLMTPMRLILLCLAGWINRKKQAVIEYLLEGIRVLKEIHGKKPRFDDV